MSAYHATHDSPYDDACPDCTGYKVTVTVDHEEREPGWPAGWAVLAIGIVALVVFAAAWSRS